MNITNCLERISQLNRLVAAMIMKSRRATFNHDHNPAQDQDRL
jgi:hypothetical protein